MLLSSGFTLQNGEICTIHRIVVLSLLFVSMLLLGFYNRTRVNGSLAAGSMPFCELVESSCALSAWVFILYLAVRVSISCFYYPVSGSCYFLRKCTPRFFFFLGRAPDSFTFSLLCTMGRKRGTCALLTTLSHTSPVNSSRCCCWELFVRPTAQK